MANNTDTATSKRALIAAINNNELTLGEAVRRMRKFTGMSQKAYAERIVGIAPRILAEIERDSGNPTVETLNKVGRPFGYTVGFVPKANSL
ncbi:MAG: XRE family transcriptional regulator [Gammaproteobacteria bacterium]|nr:MAG: XRE family transcriptional regulator [Gammaproteobacteria bacterium]RLA31004.1 MAG: XRE family transcriptional regulator [Gammaproteobacteria bacterium]